MAKKKDKKPAKQKPKGQLIKLLTPQSDFAFVGVVRNPDWFTYEHGDHLGGDEACLKYADAGGGIETLGEQRLTLFVVVYQDSEPMTWYFALLHEGFPNVPLYEWECDVPDSSIPEVLIECNEMREFKARWADADVIAVDDDEDDEGEEWKRA